MNDERAAVPARRTALLGLGFLAALHLVTPTGQLGPVALASAFTCFLLLPGLTLLTRARGHTPLLDLLAAPVLSLAFSATAFAAARSGGLGAAGAARLVAVVVLVAYAATLVRRPPPSVRWERSEVLFVVIGALLASLLLLPATSDRICVSWHGFFHTAVVEQVLAGGLPPVNPGAAGEILNYNWGFHVLVGLLTQASGVHPLHVIMIGNVLAAFFVAVASHELIRPLVRSPGARALAGLATFGALNTAAPLWLAFKQFRHGELPANEYTSGQWIDWLSQRAIPGNGRDAGGSLWDMRASSFVKEFHDVSAMGVGLFLLTASLALWMAYLEGQRQPARLALPVATWALAILYPPLALAGWVVCGVLGGLLLLGPGSAAPGRRREVFRELLLPLAAAVLLTVPYLQRVTAPENWAEAAEPFVKLGLSPKLLALPAAFLGLAPFLLLALPVLLRRRREPCVQGILLMTITMTGLATGLILQQGSQYKFLYGLCPLVGVLAMVGGEKLIALVRSPALRRVVAGALGLYLFGPVIVFEIGALTAGDFADTTWTIEGRHVERTEPSPRDHCLRWLRENSEPEAIVLVPLTGNRKSPSNVGFEMPALSARAVLVIDDPFHARRFQSFASRCTTLEQLLTGTNVAEATANLREWFPGPLYALLPDYPTDATSAWQSQGWQKVFESGDHAVLHLSPEHP